MKPELKDDLIMLRVPRALRRDLLAIAVHRGVTLSELVRQRLAAYVEGVKKKAAR